LFDKGMLINSFGFQAEKSSAMLRSGHTSDFGGLCTSEDAC